MEAAAFYCMKYNMFISIGIMYNHESALRDDKFLSKTIINQTRKWYNNEINCIRVGSLTTATDWGYAPDYVNALWHILQLPNPGTYIISSNVAHNVGDWFDVLFGYLNADWKQIVVEDSSLLKREKPVLIGDNQKLISTGWHAKVTFEEMIIRIYNNVI
jgi:GDPmannose 4,6-dehydratase